MGNEVLNIVLSVDMTEDKDSGLGTAKDTVAVINLGMTKVGSPIKYFHADGSITNPETFDLNDSTMKDAFGDGIAFVTLYGLFVRNRTGGTIQIGAATNPVSIFGTPATETFQLVDDGTFLYENPTGLSLSPGSSDQIKFSGASGEIDLIIIGATS